MPCNWTHSGSNIRRKKLREPWLSSALDVQGDTLRTNAHCIRLKCVSFVRRTIPQINVQPYLGLKPCTKGQKPPLNLSISSTKGGHKDLDLTSRRCKGHPKLITAPTNLLLCLPGVPLLILPGLCLLHGLTHLNTILSPLLIHFTHMSSHSLSGMHLDRGGGPSTTLLLPFCLHHQLNHSHYLLLL